jgi:small nuclear ribonucleoprotein (snRNP)-like protein
VIVYVVAVVLSLVVAAVAAAVGRRLDKVGDQVERAVRAVGDQHTDTEHAVAALTVECRGLQQAAAMPADGLMSRVRQRVIVTLKSQAAFRGVLFEADDRVLVLRNAEVLHAGQQMAPTAVDGELVLFVDDVEFLQRP